MQNRWFGRLRPYWIIAIALLLPAAPLSGKSDKPLGPALLEAARKGDREAVRAALENGADINTRDEKRATPLILAANAGHGEVVKLLIAKGGR